MAPPLGCAGHGHLTPHRFAYAPRAHHAPRAPIEGAFCGPVETPGSRRRDPSRRLEPSRRRRVEAVIPRRHHLGSLVEAFELLPQTSSPRAGLVEARIPVQQPAGWSPPHPRFARVLRDARRPATRRQRRHRRHRRIILPVHALPRVVAAGHGARRGAVPERERRRAHAPPADAAPAPARRPVGRGRRAGAGGGGVEGEEQTQELRHVEALELPIAAAEEGIRGIENVSPWIVEEGRPSEARSDRRGRGRRRDRRRHRRRQRRRQRRRLLERRRGGGGGSAPLPFGAASPAGGAAAVAGGAYGRSAVLGEPVPVPGQIGPVAGVRRHQHYFDPVVGDVRIGRRVLVVHDARALRAPSPSERPGGAGMFFVVAIAVIRIHSKTVQHALLCVAPG